VHLVSFTIEIYYDARTYERQIYSYAFKYLKFCAYVDYLKVYLSTYFTSQVVSIYAAHAQGPEFKSQPNGWLH
jgi:hypothetical protein